MWKLFKSKKERAKIKEKREVQIKESLQKQADLLKDRYKEELRSYCKIGGEIFILLDFRVVDNEVCVVFVSIDCAEGYCEILPIYRWECSYGHSNFKSARINFIKYKESLKSLGLTITKIEGKK